MQRQDQQSGDLQPQAGNQRAVQSVVGADPTADQIGEYPKELIQQEQ